MRVSLRCTSALSRTERIAAPSVALAADAGQSAGVRPISCCSGWPKNAAAIWFSCSTRWLPGVEQRDRQRRGLDDALQRGLGLRDADLGLAAALDVEQREGQLPAGRLAAGDDRVADDPELAPVARLQPALEGLRLALGAARSGSRCGAADGRPRAWPRC